MPDNDESATPSPDSPRDRVVREIEAIRPFIQRDGGDIEFVEFTEDGVVQVRLHGACVGCPGAAATLKHGVEARLKETIPEVSSVNSVP